MRDEPRLRSTTARDPWQCLWQDDPNGVPPETAAAKR